MGRIADAALSILARGPADIFDVAAELHAGGVTRAKDPVAAVRRALRDDVRVVDLPDGRIASVRQALAGVELTTVVTPQARRDGHVEVEPDLAPLIVLGVGPVLELPAGLGAGELVAVRVDDPDRAGLTVRAVGDVARRPADEDALLGAVGDALQPSGEWPVPPIAHLASLVLAVTASGEGVLRAPGRPLSEILAAAGFETHLGWVGRHGTDWALLTEGEAEAIEAEVARLLMMERPAEAAALQERLLALLSRHMPERVPPARRRLARALARAGRTEEALSALAGGDSPDAEDWYEAAVIASRTGDDVRARRWAESGLARADDDEPVHACLADIAHDLDAQAGLLRARGDLEPFAPDDEGAEGLAEAISRLRRSYLVEALVEEIVAVLPAAELSVLVERLAEQGERGRDACLAVAAVAGGAVGRRARALAGRDVARSPAVAGLLAAHPSAAWTTVFEDAPDQRQLIITVAREEGRVSPLIVLVDFHELGGAVKDAFFLPDMVEERLVREVVTPMEELGLRCRPITAADAVDLLRESLAITAQLGWELPSLAAQPVLDRIERQLLRPRGIVG